jgi:uncharacterized protein (TIGR03435 family)
MRLTVLVGCLLLQIVANTGAAGIPRTLAGDDDLRFEAVSIKRDLTDPTNALSGLPQFRLTHRPDGGFVMVNGFISLLIYEAYATRPADVLGMPAWVSTDRYDVSATGPVSKREPTADERRSMLRAMLADRFKWVVHDEAREEASYDLVISTADGRLGPQVRRTTPDCEARLSGIRDGLDTSNPPCGLRLGLNLYDGDTTMQGLAGMLRGETGRYVVDKTGLTGHFRITLNFARNTSASSGRPGPVAEAPSIFTALPEQLGLKLQPSRAFVTKHVTDRIERPSDN